jgi:hypothetical protein
MSQFQVLARAFFAQLFTNESATSDTQLRQAMILGLTILLPPGLFLMVAIFPEYENVTAYHPKLVDQARLRVALILVMWAMATIGYIAMFVWEGLAFERRDAMVIGPLPVSHRTVIGAKLAALGALLLGSALAINLVSALPFASVTANHLGLDAFVRDTAALLAATIGGATFVFTSLVVARTLLMLLGSPRLAARLGSLLQFLFVAGILCFVSLLPVMLTMKRDDFLAAADGSWNPGAWFLGLFEHLHGSREAGFATLARRAEIALTLSFVGSIVLSIIGVRQQMQRALAPVASAASLGRALVMRAIARLLIRRDPVARATADFILLTIARNRAQQAPVAITSAIALSFILATLAGRGDAPAGWIMPPTLDLLWMPLVLAYWIAVGLRGAFFVPSELPAAWSFRTNAPVSTRSYWLATRAAMVAVVLPPAVAATALLAAFLDWRVVAGHLLVVIALTILLVQVLTLTVSHVPFIRAYEPGHAKLRTRWPLYMLGGFLFASVPARLETRLLGVGMGAGRLLLIAFVLIALAVLLEAIGRRRAAQWSVEDPEVSASDWERLSVLDLGATMSRSPGTDVRLSTDFR